jgi:serine/threonine protein kinase
MDRNRIIQQVKQRGIASRGETLKVLKELGRGGNGVALLCKGKDAGSVVAKVYIPPDSRDVDDRALERFRTEVKLSSNKMTHPNVISALDSGTIKIGAYALPFYTMPRAKETLRALISDQRDHGMLEKRLRVFLRAALGVAWLHSWGVVHRDIKPENILLSDSGAVWVADLGIAHVNPDFVSVGLKTIAKEQLFNRDYYAPEQRYGNADKVDRRADIYALGCVLYELFMGTPPVRHQSPKVGSADPAFGVFDPIIDRMIAYDPPDRYQELEDAIEDGGMNAGWVLATLKGARPRPNEDIPTMVRMLRSANDMHRQHGVLIAKRLGEAALPTLHDLLGHNRRDARNVSAIALGEIAHPSSVPFLVGSLYGSRSSKPSTFRPAVDSAAEALSRFPEGERLRACELINQPIRPQQLVTILSGLDAKPAYEEVARFGQTKHLLLDWEESIWNVLVQIDEQRAWTEIQQLGVKLEWWPIRGLLKHLTPDHQFELLTSFVGRGIQDGWYFEYVTKAVEDVDVSATRKVPLLDEIQKQLSRRSSGSPKNRDDVLKRIQKLMADSKASSANSAA